LVCLVIPYTLAIAWPNSLTCFQSLRLTQTVILILFVIPSRQILSTPSNSSANHPPIQPARAPHHISHFHIIHLTSAPPQPSHPGKPLSRHLIAVSFPAIGRRRLAHLAGNRRRIGARNSSPNSESTEWELGVLSALSARLPEVIGIVQVTREPAPGNESARDRRPIHGPQLAQFPLAFSAGFRLSGPPATPRRR